MESYTSGDHGDKHEREFVGNCHSISAVEKPNKAQRRKTMCILSDFHSNISFSGAGLLKERECAVRDEDIIIPVGGRIASIPSASSACREKRPIEKKRFVPTKVDESRSSPGLLDPYFEGTSTEEVQVLCANMQDPLDAMIFDDDTSRKSSDSDWLMDISGVGCSKPQHGPCAEEYAHTHETTGTTQDGTKSSKLRPPAVKCGYFAPPREEKG